jgi:acetyl-CoA C-acetyltransferase
MERQDLSAYPAASLAGQRALEVAGIKVADVQLFDFYSCFPVAVFDICDALGIGDADPRPLTVTGGLPFFGGAGNNYSTHAIATMVRALRATPGTFGFVGANGGYLSKYSVGIYSTRPSAWSGLESSDLQAEVNGWHAPPLATDAADAGVVETYTIDHSRGTPRGILVCRTAAGARFVAMTDVDNSAVVERMAREEPLGAAITTLRDDRGRRIVLTFVPSI